MSKWILKNYLSNAGHLAMKSRHVKSLRRLANKIRLPALGLVLNLIFWGSVSHSETLSCDMLAQKYGLGDFAKFELILSELPNVNNYDLVRFLNMNEKLDLESPQVLRDRLNSLQAVTEYLLKNRDYRLIHSPGALQLREKLEDLRGRLFQLLDQAVKQRDSFIAEFAIIVIEKVSTMDPVTLSKETHSQYARSLVNAGSLVSRRIGDYVLTFRSLRIRVPVELQYLLLSRMADRWHEGRLRRFDIIALLTIRDWGDPVPPVEGRPVLKRMVDILFTSRHFADVKQFSYAGLFVKFLVLVDPVFAHEILDSKSFRTMAPQLARSGDRVSVDGFQFAAAYFRHVLKKPVAWIEDIAKEEAMKLEPSVTYHQRLLQLTLVKEFPDIQMEYLVPGTPFMVDFFSPGAKLVVEVDGKAHYVKTPQGANTLGLWDIRREEILQGMGFKVIRFLNEEIERALRQSPQ